MTEPKPICTHCNDTHKVEDSRYESPIMCQWCPLPCERCRPKPQGPYCVKTPCDCECHANSFQYEGRR